MNQILQEYQITLNQLCDIYNHIHYKLKMQYGDTWSKKAPEHTELWKKHLHPITHQEMRKMLLMFAEVMEERPDVFSPKFKEVIAICAHLIVTHETQPFLKKDQSLPLDNCLDCEHHFYNGRTHRTWLFIFIMEMYDFFKQMKDPKFYAEISKQAVMRKLFEFRHGHSQE